MRGGGGVAAFTARGPCHRYVRAGRCFAAALACSLASGCVAPAPEDSAAAFPSFGELAPAEAPVLPPQPGAGAAAVSVTLTRVELPLDVSLEPAWAEVDEDAAPPLSRGVWRANGLRVGVLPAERLASFLEALPAAWSDRSYRVERPDGPVVIRQSLPLVRSVAVDLTVPPWAANDERLLGGRAALLMELQPAGRTLAMRLTPLHQKPTATLKARTAREKELEGRRFDGLSLRFAVPAGDYAVIGLAREATGLQTAVELRTEAQAEAAAPAAVEADPPAADDGVPPPTRVVEAPAPLPTDLGRALFTGREASRGTPQILLILGPA